MATFAKKCLSPGGTEGNGLPILIGTTSTDIHRTTTSTTTYDEIWLYAHNYDSTSARKLTIEFGGTNDKDDIEILVPSESGLILIVPGLILRSGGTALNVTGFSATGTIAVSGYVNRIS